MPAGHGVSVVGGFALGVACAAACPNLVDTARHEGTLTAIVQGHPIQPSEVAREAGEELCTAIREARNVWLKSLEFVIARRLLEEEAFQAGKSVREVLSAEVSGKLTRIPDQQVMQVATRRAGTQPPPAGLIEQVRGELEAQALQTLRENYLARLEEKYGVTRSPEWSSEAGSTLDLCQPSQVGIEGLDRPAAPHTATRAVLNCIGVDALANGAAARCSGGAQSRKSPNQSNRGRNTKDGTAIGSPAASRCLQTRFQPA